MAAVKPNGSSAKVSEMTPDSSVERAAPGKPSAASHIKS
jgi:hypothetical protein